jgi:hypothetical protein
MSAQECRRARELWSEEFDGGPPAPTWVRRHAAACGECAEFRGQALRLRQELAGTPLPHVGPERDEALLSVLQAEPAVPGRARFWNPLDRVRRALGLPAAPALVGVGLSAFLVTLITAQLLSSPAGDHPERVVPGSTSAREPARTDDRDALELWLTSPQPRRVPRSVLPRNTAPFPDSKTQPTAPEQRRGEGLTGGAAADLT